MPRLLVVDDSESICWGIAQLAQDIGFQVDTASSAEESMKLVTESRPDLICLDVRLPGMDGLDAMAKLRPIVGDIPIIVMTAYGDLDTAVRAVRNGAFDYILKPFDLKKIEACLLRATAQHSESTDEEQRPAAPHGMLGDSPAIQEVFKQIALVANSAVGVLINGESGTGKELAARAIHAYSQFADGPFVPVNVASLNPALVESELFGHVPGAFTGADSERLGFLPRANKGTLFLDEVADIPLNTQVKLLRCLEYGQVTPVGSTNPIDCRFRIVCATHQNLEALIDSGEFRHDLYYRLCSYKIDLPPLRQRGSDIILLAKTFANDASANRRITFSEEALQLLSDRKWAGNVRELKSAVNRAMVLARGSVILPEHLSESNQPEAQSDVTHWDTNQLDDQLRNLIRQWAVQRLEDPNCVASEKLHEELLRLVEPPVLEAALQHYDGQYSAAARRLGVHRTTLKRRIDENSPTVEE